jgi:hypothetical protein
MSGCLVLYPVQHIFLQAQLELTTFVNFNHLSDLAVKSSQYLPGTFVLSEFGLLACCNEPASELIVGELQFLHNSLPAARVVRSIVRLPLRKSNPLSMHAAA